MSSGIISDHCEKRGSVVSRFRWWAMVRAEAHRDVALLDRELAEECWNRNFGFRVHIIRLLMS